MTCRCWGLVCAFGMCLATAAAQAQATTRLVPSEYATIQAGIDAAVAGDEVVIADGVYTGTGNKDLDFHGKAITVRSASGNADACVIDCEGSGRGFRFDTHEDAASVVAGLMIRNGAPGISEGGGVYCYLSSPTLLNCTIASNHGGGMYCESADPTLTNCRITDNTAGNGAGIYLVGASPTLLACVISGNTADDTGGGLFCSSSGVTLVNCVIANNTAGYGGGGLDCGSARSPTLINCAITGNRAEDGGGVYCRCGNPTLTGCLIAGNTGDYEGGGVCFYYSNGPLVTNCTIVGNTSTYHGGGVCCYSSTPVMTNCILWANAPEQILLISSDPVVTFSDIQDGWSGAGNISVDPRFAFPTEWHLLPGSPCIDAGVNDPAGALPSLDLDGQLRLVDGNGDGAAMVDMGAYEFDSSIPRLAVNAAQLAFSVRPGETGSCDLEIRNCSTGALAWELQSDADWLAADPTTGESSGEVDTVALAADTSDLTHGTYCTTLWVNADGAPGTPRAVTVVLHVTAALQVPGQFATIQAAINAALEGDEVVLADGAYTGLGNRDLDFGGRAITVRSASGNPDACIIDCQGAGRGFYFHSGESASSRVTGLTIRNGSATSGSPGGFEGGGVVCDFSGPTLSNCTITGNAAYFGGGVYCCVAGPTLSNCEITDSTAEYGGSVFCGSCSPTFTSCRIMGSTARYGGGVYCNDASPTFTDCIIAANGADDGAGVLCSLSNATLGNCTIVNNSSTSEGGGVYCTSSSPLIINCILWANALQQILVVSGDPVVTHSDIQAGWSGVGNIDVDPRFAFPAEWHLLPESPCVDAGVNDLPGGLPPLDLDGQPRVVDGNADGAAVADMGAYEFDPSAPRLAISASELAISARLGQTVSRELNIRNSNTGTLAWSLQSDVDWLAPAPVAGESTGEVDTVTLTAHTSGLAHGTHLATLWVNADGALGAPRGVIVVLHVTAALQVPAQYASIQAAIDAAISGDEVVLADGIYTGVGNRDLDFDGKAITVRSASGNREACIIDCQSAGRGFYFHTTETSDATVRDLSIRNGSVTAGSPGGSDGGGVLCVSSSPTLINCAIGGTTALFGGGIYCNSAGPTFNGCTIAGGAATYGGGVSCYSSNATFSNCTISSNAATYGAGVRCLLSTVTLTNCIVTNNDARAQGGGVYCSNDNATLTDCMIGSNTTGGQGGGLYCSYASPILTNCTVADNGSDYDGGGVYCEAAANPTLTNCTVVHNAATAGDGGGVHCHSADPVLTSCTISRNTAWDGYGGGVYCDGASPALTNCLITRNVANMAGDHVDIEDLLEAALVHSSRRDRTGGCGGGVFSGNLSNPTLTNCTIVGNSAEYSGGGVYGTSASATLTNCILWMDHPSEIWFISGSPIVTYSDVYAGWSGAGNIDGDPRFRVACDRIDFPATWVDADFRLTRGSPCIDAGNNAAVRSGVATDLDGSPRFVDDPATPDSGAGTPPIVDLGAYESPPNPVVVICRGDSDCDGHVDFSDIDLFVAAIPDEERSWAALYAARHGGAEPPCAFLNNDCTGDGHVGFDDIDPFVALIPSACP